MEFFDYRIEDRKTLNFYDHKIIALRMNAKLNSEEKYPKKLVKISNKVVEITI